MKKLTELANRKHLSSVYQRIKVNCCAEWKLDRTKFYKWYENTSQKQKHICYYCHLPGDTTINYIPEGFREGRRGFNLEVDRKNPKGKYSPKNCVLACYPCNNAKSDVFSHSDFLMIGQAIRVAKTRKLPPKNQGVYPL
jgi:5-methylcytosine-specific restriction endonuclease McrA